MILLALLLAHLLYDFHWQGSFISNMKGKSWFLLGIHALTWALVLWFTLALFGNATSGDLVWLFVTHFAIDAWKARYNKRFAPLGAALWIDQGLHICSLLVVVLI